jgi:hypothetical protein
MDLNPASCWDCPEPWAEMLAWSGAVLLLLWAGLSWRRSSHPFVHGSGTALVVLATITTLFLCIGVQKFGINWPGMHPWLSPRRSGVEAFFVASWLGAQGLLVLRARRKSPKAH